MTNLKKGMLVKLVSGPAAELTEYRILNLTRTTVTLQRTQGFGFTQKCPRPMVEVMSRK